MRDTKVVNAVKRLGWLCLVSLGLVGILATSDPTRPTPPAFAITDLTVSRSNAAVGDMITFSWNYNKEIRAQKVELIYLTIRGFLSTTPVLQCAINGPDACMDTERTGRFRFQGPVKVHIRAESTTGEIIEAAFDVRNLESAYFKARVWQDNTTYPVLGSSQTLDFTTFFGIYEDIANSPACIRPSSPVCAEDSVVTQLEIIPNIDAVMPRDSPFLGRSLSTGQNPFFLQQGRAFPLLDSDYLWNNPDAFDANAQHRFTEINYTHADAMIIAAALFLDGTVKQGKTGDGRQFDYVDGGDGLVHRGHPVFMQVDLRSERNFRDTRGRVREGAKLHVVDMHLGNFAQGFVASAYWGRTPDRHLALGGYRVPYSIPGAASGQTFPTYRLYNGSVKDSKLGFIVGGYPQYTTVSDLSWNEVPFYSDRDFLKPGALIGDIRAP